MATRQIFKNYALENPMFLRFGLICHETATCPKLYNWKQVKTRIWSKAFNQELVRKDFYSPAKLSPIIVTISILKQFKCGANIMSKRKVISSTLKEYGKKLPLLSTPT